MSSFSFNLASIPELKKALLDLDKKVGKKVIQSAVKRGLTPMKQAAIAKVPVDTGLLKRSIKVRTIAKSRTHFGQSVSISDTSFRGEAFYGYFQEYGTSKMPAKGFLRKAFDETKDESLRIAIDELKKGVNL